MKIPLISKRLIKTEFTAENASYVLIYVLLVTLSRSIYKIRRNIHNKYMVHILRPKNMYMI